jgi:UDP-N-acetylmuramate--alanine ligase
MNWSAIQHIFFLGIGGIGMSALARYFHAKGIRVSGYDKTPSSHTDRLKAEGIAVCFDDQPSFLPQDVDLVVYTPAIPQNSPGFIYFSQSGIQMMKRAEVLGCITLGQQAICVAGSHGKTTVSAMIAHILTHSNYGCSAFLGGISINYQSNYLTHPGKTVVVEADEFDRSFHRLSPDIAVITSVDTDHLDVYGTKEQIDEAFLTFTQKINPEGLLVIKEGQSIQDKLPVIDKVFYHFSDPGADLYCSKYWVVDGGTLFHVSYFNTFYGPFRLNIGGLHNVENALAAIAVALELKIPVEKIQKAIASFCGIKRRFEVVLRTDNVVFIDDYAHHPEELRALLNGVRALYPGRKITIAFQPHLFSRTRDLAIEFAQSLDLADEVLLLDIYPARELPMPGVTSALIYDAMQQAKKIQVSRDTLVDTLRQLSQPEIFVTAGAGDIDTCIPAIKNYLESRG